MDIDVKSFDNTSLFQLLFESSAWLSNNVFTYKHLEHKELSDDLV